MKSTSEACSEKINMKNLNDFLSDIEDGDFVKIFLSPNGDYKGYAEICPTVKEEQVPQVALSGFRPNGYYRNQENHELRFSLFNHPFSFLDLTKGLFYIDGGDKDKDAISVLGYEVIERRPNSKK